MMIALCYLQHACKGFYRLKSEVSTMLAVDTFMRRCQCMTLTQATALPYEPHSYVTNVLLRVKPAPVFDRTQCGQMIAAEKVVQRD